MTVIAPHRRISRFLIALTLVVKLTAKSFCRRIMVSVVPFHRRDCVMKTSWKIVALFLTVATTSVGFVGCGSNSVPSDKMGGSDSMGNDPMGGDKMAAPMNDKMEPMKMGDKMANEKMSDNKK